MSAIQNAHIFSIRKIIEKEIGVPTIPNCKQVILLAPLAAVYIMGSARHWCFTGHDTKHEPIKFDETKIKYLVYQKEIAPETKKEHWQGYVIFIGRYTLCGAKKMFEQNVHLEVARASPQKNIEYCTKITSAAGEPPKIFGSPETSRGERTDLKSLAKAVIEGKENYELIESHPDQMLRYSKHVEHLRSLAIKPRSTLTRAIWCYGPAGTGKSEKANAFPGAYWKASGMWWNGYIGQKVVVIDEVDKGDIKRVDFCRLVDKFPLQVQFKGGMIHFNSDLIIFTSNYSPEEIFGSEKFDSVKRRMEVWRHEKGHAPIRESEADWSEKNSTPEWTAGDLYRL